MMKKVLVTIAGMLLLSSPAMAIEIPQGTATAPPAYNCDYEPSCEVSPGIYGKMASPVTSKFNLSIGGFVELQYAYNSQNLGVNGYVFPGAPTGGLSPVGSNLAKEHQSEFSARTSRFWLKVAGPTFLGAKTNALIEADFIGTSATLSTNVNENGFLRLRHAYGSLDWPNTQVLFGQFWDIFGPASAGTIDFRHGATTGAPNNPRVAQIRLTQKIPFNDDNSLKLVVGVQNPVQDYMSPGDASTSTIANGDAPNVAAQLMFVSKALGVAPGPLGMSMNSLQAGFFGLWGNEQLNVAGVNHTNSVDAYGYGFYGFIPLLKSKDGMSRAMTASLETQGYISAGINWDGANASTNLAFTNASVSPPAGAAGLVSNLYRNGSAAKGYGVYGQLIFYPIQDLGITTGYMRRNAMNYGQFTNTISGAGAVTTFEAYNEIIYANINYDLNAAVKLATEYEHAKTQYGRNFNATGTIGNFGQDNIFRVSAFYFF